MYFLRIATKTEEECNQKHKHKNTECSSKICQDIVANIFIGCRGPQGGLSRGQYGASGMFLDIPIYCQFCQCVRACVRTLT